MNINHPHHRRHRRLSYRGDNYNLVLYIENHLWSPVTCGPPLFCGTAANDLLSGTRAIAVETSTVANPLAGQQPCAKKLVNAIATFVGLIATPTRWSHEEKSPENTHVSVAVSNRCPISVALEELYGRSEATLDVWNAREPGETTDLWRNPCWKASDHLLFSRGVGEKSDARSIFDIPFQFRGRFSQIIAALCSNSMGLG